MFIGVSDDANLSKIFFISKRIPLNYDLIEAPFAHSLRELPAMLEKHYDLLVRANIHKSKEELEQALEELRGMRDTWKQVMKNAKSM